MMKADFLTIDANKMKANARWIAILCLFGASPLASAAFLVEVWDLGSSDVTSIAAAEAPMGGPSSASGYYDDVNFNDEFLHYDGEFSGSNSLFPLLLDDTFSLRATAEIIIEDAGTYTFGFNSDDGAVLRLNGVDIVTDDSVHAPRTRLSTFSLSAGSYGIELIYFENHGAGTIELFSALGTYAAFDPGAFRLIGDVAGGGIATTAVPIPPALLLMGSALIGVFFRRRQR